MNIDTGEIRPWDQLTDAEKKSGKWVPATEEAQRAWREKLVKQEQREHNRQVRREQEALSNPALAAKRKAKNEAKRARKLARQRAIR